MVYGGGTRKPLKVILFCAVLYSENMKNTHQRIVSENFGAVYLRSPEFDFSHTAYYQPEMGSNLCKYFVGFDKLIYPDEIMSYKLDAVKLEETFLQNQKRCINIDPGYVALEKVVAASTKNFTHRIFIGNSIYCDLQLVRRKNRYETLPWTFYDYSTKLAFDFFESMRVRLKKELENE